MKRMLEAALAYHAEGLCVIPVIWRQKNPALGSWAEYQKRRSTHAEVKQWFGARRYNIGIVHGEVAEDGNYVVIDIDDDTGLLKELYKNFPILFDGRVDQSGSHEGYHIPLLLDELPDFGTDADGKPRGNHTWKLPGLGKANIRSQRCQTVSPPSCHECGRRYRHLKEGPLARLSNLDDLMAWLNEKTPQSDAKGLRQASRRDRQYKSNGDDLISAVRGAWSPLEVFQHFGVASRVRQEPNGELRLLNNGGLLIREDEWYCFEDEIGGGAIEAWGWCRHGSAFNKPRQFREVLLEMAQAAGMDTARWYRRGDERVSVPDEGDRGRWNRDGAWGRMR